jgi:hypothetical protein
MMCFLETFVEVVDELAFVVIAVEKGSFGL